MQRGVATVALCFLLILSGCSALPGGTSGDSPPGVEDGALNNSSALVDAHSSALTESGYTHEVRLNQSQLINGNLANITRKQRTNVTAGAGEYRFQLINGGDANSRFVIWGNETVEYQRIEISGGDPQYRQSEPTPPRALSGVAIFEPQLTAPFEVVDRSEVDGTTLVTLEATGQPTSEKAFPSDAESIRNYEARLVVDTQGRIHEFTASADYDLNGESTSYDLSYAVTSFESPDVQRPSWVDELEG
ncbi:MAG: hypothetical protein ACI8UR_002393 [Natronomonas sp.]|jgi:hypothetical protein|uniref:DUF7537 family lipoprotein n=1 Tax=Natronomonas sp. TaxID=2184060 RepID=UPI003989E77D